MTPPRLGVWPTLPPAAWIKRPKRSLPYPLAERGCRLHARARHALWHGVKAVGLEEGDVVLVPAYHHGSEIEALVRAGLGCRFYGGRELEPVGEELERLLGPRVRALYLIHYLGYPQDGASWRRWCDERGLLLIEDAAQSWLASADGAPAGSHGQLAVYCLYKSFGLPDGAAARLEGGEPFLDTAAAPGLVAAAQKHAAWLAERSGRVVAGLDRLRSPRPYDAATDFALGEPSRAISPAARFLLPRVAGSDAAATRRANAAELGARIGELVPAPFRELPPGSSPFALPVEVADKERTLAELLRRGVAPLDFWGAPHPALAVKDFPDARRRRERTLALPVHQDLPRGALARIAAALEQSTQ